MEKIGDYKANFGHNNNLIGNDDTGIQYENIFLIRRLSIRFFLSTTLTRTETGLPPLI